MPAEAGGSIATTMRASGGASATRQVQPTARPQRIGALLDDLAVQLLAAKPGTGIAPDHRIEKRRREMARVTVAARAIGRPVSPATTSSEGPQAS